MIFVIGRTSGRLSCIVDSLYKSKQYKNIHVSTNFWNSALAAQSTIIIDSKFDNYNVIPYIKEHKPDFAIVCDESSLENGLVDRLLYHGIPTIGPTSKLARIETSKIFSRNLIQNRFQHYDLNPIFKVFNSSVGLESFMNELKVFVIKPDGLTGGKGVKVIEDHFFDIQTALYLCEMALTEHSQILIEEKLYGKEFSLMSFSDGNTVVHMPPVRDHKRLYNENKGPNTGGMGSYSCADHLLPYISKDNIGFAQYINMKTIEYLQWSNGQQYKGILYGNYIQLSDGSLKVIEFNSRFGDPEVMNVLSILKNDFIDVCRAITQGTLETIDVQFENKATVCKYSVPISYPSNNIIESPVDVTNINTRPDLKVFWSNIETVSDGNNIMKGSRAIATVGIGNTLSEAEMVSETAANEIIGDVFHRTDIGNLK